jgi:IS30 family transposase
MEKICNASRNRTVLEVDFYFANPYSPWERGANENLNGLIRQYIPKSTSFEEITIERIIEIQEKLNNRPRKDLILKHQIICLIKSCICNLNPTN